MGRHSSNPNMTEYGSLHFKYRQQMRFLEGLGDEFEVVMFRPSYHAQKGDCNTVLFYFKEDDEYNRKVDRENPGLSLETKNQMYRRQFFSFENTDCNGRFSHDFANFGRIDLRPLSWESALRGAFELAYYSALQNRYIASVGGILSLPEADDEYNDFNRKKISAFKKMHPRACKGRINFYGETRRDLLEAKVMALTEYDGGMVYNFGCDFIVPKFDEQLNELIKAWNLESKAAKIEEIFDRVNTLGGIHLIWR